MNREKFNKLIRTKSYKKGFADSKGYHRSFPKVSKRVFTLVYSI